ncbi:MAG: lipopolysaccharide biosynthesis protein [Candidatus Helarchaeota archaeon]
MDNLGTRVVRSGAWIFGMRFVHQLLYLMRLVILARLLAPHDFGLIGIAMLTIAALDTFSQTGFQEALIQKKEGLNYYLNSAWTMMVIRGVGLFAVVFISAPLIAKIFGSPQAKLVIQVIGITLIFQGLTNIGIVYFKKELEFRKQFAYQVIGTITDFIVSLGIVIFFRNVWALVFGIIAGNIARLFISYFLHPFRPRIEFNFGRIKSLFNYGKWILGSMALTFLITQGDDIFVGKFLGVTMLGFYQVAYKISNTPATEITHLISQVTFPAYSKLQDNIDKLRRSYLKVLKVVAFLSFPLVGIIFSFAPELILFLLGKKWTPIIPVIQVLIFAGLFRSFASTASSVFYGIGKPKLDTLWQVVRLIVLAVLIYPLTVKWNLVGASLAVVASISISNIGFILYANKLTKTSFKDFIKVVYVPLLSTIFFVVVVLWLKNLIGTGLFEIFLILLISGFLYILLVLISIRFFSYQIWDLIKEKIIPAFRVN